MKITMVMYVNIFYHSLLYIYKKEKEKKGKPDNFSDAGSEISIIEKLSSVDYYYYYYYYYYLL